MLDPIWGPLIHIFVDEKKNWEGLGYKSILPYDSRILSFGSLEEKMNRKGKGGWYLEKEFFFAEEK